jgi:hypothetical protein
MAKNTNTSFIVILFVSGIALFYLYKKNKNKKSNIQTPDTSKQVTPKPVTPIRVPSAVTSNPQPFIPPPSAWINTYLQGAAITKPSIASEPSAINSELINPHLQPIRTPTRSISIASEY